MMSVCKPVLFKSVSVTDYLYYYIPKEKPLNALRKVTHLAVLRISEVESVLQSLHDCGEDQFDGILCFCKPQMCSSFPVLTFL